MVWNLLVDIHSETRTLELKIWLNALEINMNLATISMNNEDLLTTVWVVDSELSTQWEFLTSPFSYSVIWNIMEHVCVMNNNYMYIYF